jgi:hypothetical protein
VAPSHLAIEELHPQLPAVASPGRELRAGAEEAVVLADLDRHAGRGLPAAHVVEHPPLAGKGADDARGPVAGHGPHHLVAQRPGIGRIVERHVVDRQPLRPQRVGEMAHGREQEGDLLRMVADIGRLGRHLGDQHRVGRPIDVAQRRHRPGQLVPQNDAEDRHPTPSGTGVRRT